MSRDVSSFLLSFLGFCTRGLSALRPSLVRPFEFTCGFLRVCSFCCLVRVRCCWHTVCSGNPNPCLGGNPPVHGVIGVLPRPYGRLPTAQCIEGSRRSTVISLCQPLWRALASAAEGADSFTSRSVCLRWGGHPSEARPFRSVGWHSCPD